MDVLAGFGGLSSPEPLGRLESSDDPCSEAWPLFSCDQDICCHNGAARLAEGNLRLEIEPLHSSRRPGCDVSPAIGRDGCVLLPGEEWGHHLHVSF